MIQPLLGQKPDRDPIQSLKLIGFVIIILLALILFAIAAPDEFAEFRRGAFDELGRMFGT